MIKLAICNQTDKGILRKNVKEPTQDTTLKTDSQSVKPHYLFLKRTLNPDYASGLIDVPLRSCLIHHKSDKKKWVIKSKPKWQTDLLQSDFCTDTGEMLGQSIYSTDDLKGGNNRKIKAVNKFSNHFEPIYNNRKCSLLFITLTLANQSRLNIKQLMDVLKKRCKRNGVDVLGTLWIIEISQPEINKSGLHVHYHLILATSRIKCAGKGLPPFLKLNTSWGARTQVGFVEKNVKYYLSSYFKKNNWRIENKRSYGMNIKKTS